ncbi:MAG TPA: response regulator [Pyrinomonadaceae bacterium]|nr:response regulator [Pyrinomonadaceae bacterium]
MKSKVLVVEDYEDTREFMKFLLQDYGFDVAEATNGYEAIEAVKRQVPDLILMDISMPGMDGLTAARKIREESGPRRPAIIAITAYGEAARRKALEAGCDASLSKPIDFEDLEPVLSRYLPKENRAPEPANGNGHTVGHR